MEALETFFKNQFTGERFSNNTLKKFSEDHLARITANPGPPGGPIILLIAPTGAAHLNYFGNISNVDVASAVQQGLTKSLDAKFKEAVDYMKRAESIIRYVYGKEAQTYQEFYPYGLTEYTNATKETIETLMLRFVAAATNNPDPDLPGTLAAEVQTYHDDYQDLRAAQLGKKGDTDIQRAERNVARAALELQLWKNLLTISLAHLGDVDACTAYFDESILNAGNGSSEDDDAEEGEGPGA